MKYLKMAIWTFDVDYNTFFPRSYDLSESCECSSFETDFKRSAASSILKRVVQDRVYSPRAIPNQETINVRVFHLPCPVFAIDIGHLVCV